MNIKIKDFLQANKNDDIKFVIRSHTTNNTCCTGYIQQGCIYINYNYNYNFTNKHVQTWFMLDGYIVIDVDD